MAKAGAWVVVEVFGLQVEVVFCFEFMGVCLARRLRLLPLVC